MKLIGNCKNWNYLVYLARVSYKHLWRETLRECYPENIQPNSSGRCWILNLNNYYGKLNSLCLPPKNGGNPVQKITSPAPSPIQADPELTFTQKVLCAERKNVPFPNMESCFNTFWVAHAVDPLLGCMEVLFFFHVCPWIHYNLSTLSGATLGKERNLDEKQKSVF